MPARMTAGGGRQASGRNGARRPAPGPREHLPGRGAALGHFLARSRVRWPGPPLVGPSLLLLTVPPPAHAHLHGVTPVRPAGDTRTPLLTPALCSPAPRFPVCRLLVHLHGRLGGRHGQPHFTVAQVTSRLAELGRTDGERLRFKPVRSGSTAGRRDRGTRRGETRLASAEGGAPVTGGQAQGGRGPVRPRMSLSLARGSRTLVA